MKFAFHGKSVSKIERELIKLKRTEIAILLSTVTKIASTFLIDAIVESNFIL